MSTCSEQEAILGGSVTISKWQIRNSFISDQSAPCTVLKLRPYVVTVQQLGPYVENKLLGCTVWWAWMQVESRLGYGDGSQGAALSQLPVSFHDLFEWAATCESTPMTNKLQRAEMERWRKRDWDWGSEIFHVVKPLYVWNSGLRVLSDNFWKDTCWQEKLQAEQLIYSLWNVPYCTVECKSFHPRWFLGWGGVMGEKPCFYFMI